MDRIPMLRWVMTRSWVFSTPPKKLNIRGNYVCAMWTFLLKLWDKRAYFWEVWHPKKNDPLESRSLEEFRHRLSQNTNIQLAFFWIIFRQWMTKGASQNMSPMFHKEPKCCALKQRRVSTCVFSEFRGRWKLLYIFQDSLYIRLMS